MKPELIEIKYIEDFLLDRLNESEKQAFNMKMKDDIGFAHRVEMQRIVMRRVQRIALKQSVSNAHKRFLRRQKFSFENSIFKHTFNTIITLIGIMLIGYAVWVSKDTPNDDKQVKTSVRPPIKGIDVPYKTHVIQVEKGAVLNYETGSTVIVPANAFVYENGNPVAGEIELNFREFNDATDIFIAGIPMANERYGKNMFLESAAMCEINAFKDGEAIKISLDKKIEIIQASYTENRGFSLYHLNNKTGKWIERGKDIPLDLRIIPMDKQVSSDENELKKSNIQKPIKPKRTEDFNQTFTIDFEENEFPELAIYKNIEFAIDKSDKEYKKSHADIEWEDVQLKKGSQKGAFIITFKKGAKSVSYKVYPAFKGQDYEQAIKTYNKKLNEYNSNLSINRENEKQRVLLLANKRQDSINKLIELRNTDIEGNSNWLEIEGVSSLSEMKQVLKQSALVSKEIKDKLNNSEKNNENFIEKSYNELILARQIFKKWIIVLSNTDDIELQSKLMAFEPDLEQLIESKKLIETACENLEQKILNKPQNKQNILRAYGVNELGVWNCAQAIWYPKEVSLIADFSLNNKHLPLKNINLVAKGIQSIFQYKSKAFNQFKYELSAKNIIWSVIDGERLIYFNDFSSIPKNIAGKTYTFKMKELNEPLTDYETVKKLIGDL